MEGSWWPLECLSRKLMPTEISYSTYLSIRHFRHMLTGRMFHVLTDHCPLTQALVRKGEPWSPQQTCQLAYVSEFTCDIQNISGPNNTVADALSRDVFEQLNSITFCTLDEFAAAQKTCKDVKALINSPGLSCTSRSLPSGNILHYNTSTSKPRIIIPMSLREKVVKQFHDIHHPSIRSTRRLVSTSFVWGRVAATMKDVVNQCHSCHLVKTPKKLQRPPGQLPTPA